ncbi:MAG: hypothetical protein JWR09_4829 [Mucilaginibacter sp.]|nr:hypothetical protein [Mucilaginibacter sp.]
MFHSVPPVPRKNGTLCRRGHTNVRFAPFKATTARGWRRVQGEVTVCLCRIHIKLCKPTFFEKMIRLHQLAMIGYIEHEMGCHPEPVEGRRAQRPLPASWFDKLTMTGSPLSFLLQNQWGFISPGCIGSYKILLSKTLQAISSLSIV